MFELEALGAGGDFALDGLGVELAEAEHDALEEFFQVGAGHPAEIVGVE